MPKKYNLKGEKFGNYKVLEEVGSKNGRRMWKCECMLCGNIREVSTNGLISGRQKSCGCQSYNDVNNGFYKHGLSNHKLNRLWRDIKTRCYNPNCKAYKYYGAKGICMCDEWKDNFMKFFEWSLDNGWEEGLSIERIDNEKDYSPSNCKFITFDEQQRHKTNLIMIEYQGENHCLAVWCHRFNINYDRTRKRLMNGWSVDEAFTTECFEIRHKNNQKGVAANDEQ